MPRLASIRMSLFWVYWS